MNETITLVGIAHHSELVQQFAGSLNLGMETYTNKYILIIL